MNKTKTLRIIFFVGTFVSIAVLVWCHRVFCRRNEKKSLAAPRLLIKKNWNRRRGRLVSASPLHDLPSNRERSASYLPLISPHSSKPPPLGFKYSANMPQPDISKAIGFSGHVDAYPSTSGTPYPPNLKNNRDSCSTTTSYSATHSTPYPLFSVMPLPSTSRTSYPPEHRRSETPDSISSIPYPLSNRNGISISSRTSYPPELNTHGDLDCANITPYPSADGAPYPLSSIAVTQHSSSSPYPPEHMPRQVADSTKNVPYVSIHEAPYLLPNQSSLPQPTTEGSSEWNARFQRPISYPTVSTTSLSVVQRPPSYAEAVHNKF